MLKVHLLRHVLTVVLLTHRFNEHAFLWLSYRLIDVGYNFCYRVSFIFFCTFLGNLNFFMAQSEVKLRLLDHFVNNFHRNCLIKSIVICDSLKGYLNLKLGLLGNFFVLYMTITLLYLLQWIVHSFNVADVAFLVNYRVKDF